MKFHDFSQSLMANHLMLLLLVVHVICCRSNGDLRFFKCSTFYNSTTLLIIFWGVNIHKQACCALLHSFWAFEINVGLGQCIMENMIIFIIY